MPTTRCIYHGNLIRILLGGSISWPFLMVVVLHYKMPHCMKCISMPPMVGQVTCLIQIGVILTGRTTCPQQLCCTLITRKFCLPFLRPDVGPPLWANSRVLFHTDNITARAALHKGSARSPAIMPLLRELFWLSAIFNFHIDACYVPGELNDTPDCISRLNQPGYVAQLLNLMGIPVNCMYYVYICLLSHMSYGAFGYLLPQIWRYILWSPGQMPA